MLSILAVGQDEGLLATRAAVLRRAKADVMQAKPVAAVRMLRTTSFDLVVLCHSLSRVESTGITKAARRRADGARVLQVITGALRGTGSEGVPVDCVAEGDPGRLAHRVSALLQVVDLHAAEPGRGRPGQVLNFQRNRDRHVK
jgi:hypothetical protein